MAKFRCALVKYLRQVPVYLAVILLPVTCKLLLHAGLPVYMILLLTSVKFFLEGLAAAGLPQLVRKICRIISACFSVIYGFLLLVTIIITPQSVFAFFFEAAPGLITGVITDEYFLSDIFVLLAVFFSLFFGTAALKQQSYKPLLGLAGMACGLLLIIYQSLPFLLLLIVVMLLFLFINMGKRAVYVLYIFLLCIGMASLFYAFKNEPAGSALVDNVFFPGIRKIIDNQFPQFPLLIDIPGYGMGFRTSRLGGVTMLTSTPVLELQGNRNEAIYLRTNSYDTYQNNGWTQSVTEGEAVDPVPLSAQLSGEPRVSQLKVKILVEIFPLVPFTSDTIGFQYNGNFYPFDHTRHYQGMKFGDGFKKNSVLTLYRGTRPEEWLQPAEVFLQVPENLPQSVRQLAAELGRSAASQSEILMRIEYFLALNYTYNLQAPELNPGDDFLEKFLFEDKRGYCTHFATAFVILARLNGIPSRYMHGYLAYLYEESHIKTVTARTAHAWPEVWLPARGWVTWEATRVLDLDYYRDYYDEMYDDLSQFIFRGNEIARNSLTLNQLRDLLGLNLRFEESEQAAPGLVFSLPPVVGVIFWILLYCSGAALLLFLLIKLLKHRKEARQWQALLNRLVKCFKRAVPPEVSGWVHWKDSICAIYRINSSQAETLLTMILRITYRNRSASGAEIDFLKQFLRSAAKKPRIDNRITAAGSSKQQVH